MMMETIFSWDTYLRMEAQGTLSASPTLNLTKPKQTDSVNKDKTNTLFSLPFVVSQARLG